MKADHWYVKLSDDQLVALRLIREFGGLSEAMAGMHLGRARRQTMKALLHRGLVRYHYTSELWRITADGSQWFRDDAKACREGRVGADLLARFDACCTNPECEANIDCNGWYEPQGREMGVACRLHDAELITLAERQNKPTAGHINSKGRQVAETLRRKIRPQPVAS